MKKIRPYLQKLASSLALFCAFYPLFLYCGFRLAEGWGKVLILEGLTLVWGNISFQIKKGRLAFSLSGTLLLGAYAWFFLVSESPFTLLLLIPCILMLFFLPRSFPEPPWQEWNAALWIAGLIAYLAVNIIIQVNSYRALLLPLNIAFTLFVFLFLWTLNHRSVRTGMHASAKAPAPLRIKNKLLIICVFLIGLLASCWQTLSVFLNEAWEGFKQLIVRLFELIASLFPASTTSGGSEEGGGMDLISELGGAGEQSLFSKILEKIVMVLACLIFALLLILAVRFLWKKAVRLIRRLMEKMKDYSAAAGGDYVDEVESIADSRDSHAVLKKADKGKSMRAGRNWKDLNPSEKIRFLYRDFIRKKTPPAHLTAREALTNAPVPAAFPDLYDRARYSSEEMKDELAENLKKEMRKI